MATTSASTTSKQQIEATFRTWKGHVSDADRALFGAFVKEAAGKLRGPFLAQHPPATILQYLEEAFLFARQRAPGEVKVAVHPRANKGFAVISNMDDQAFIVDTVRLYLKQHQTDWWGGFNVVLNVKRDAAGQLVAVGGEGSPESLVLQEGDAGDVAADPEGSAGALRANLELARATVIDFKAMTRQIERYCERCDVLAERQPERAEAFQETSAFLKWLLRDNFVFMGTGAADEHFGIQRIAGPFQGSAKGDWAAAHEPGTVRVRKSSQESPIHRVGRIDEILVEIHEDVPPLFLRGMFTYRAVTQPSRNVPILRKVLASILAAQNTAPGSFRYKGIANVFDSLPTEFLLIGARQIIANMVDRVFEAEMAQEVNFNFLMTGPDSAFCLVAMPKEQFGDDLRRDVETEIRRSLQASYADHGVFVGRYDTMLLHYFLTGVVDPGADGIKALSERIRDLATPWQSRLHDALAAAHGEAEADRLGDKYGHAFPETYTHGSGVGQVVRDVAACESLGGDRNIVAALDEVEGKLFLRLYQRNDVYLTDILPVLDNFGLVVISSSTVNVRTASQDGADTAAINLDVLTLQGAKGVDSATVLQRAGLLTEALGAVFDRRVTDDPINRLVLSSGLSWQDVDLVRGYARYTRQVQIKLDNPRIVEILLANPVTCHALVDLFHARFDPDLTGDRAAEVAKAAAVVKEELRQIESHDEDLLLSAIHHLIGATIRTNFYRTDRKGHYLSFKFDAQAVKLGPANKPMFEIYVHNKDVEGVHLRFGKVARGGLRFSDRDDFRTEVLALATTQQVKNVVIVPTGSKGGFYVRNASRDPATRKQQGDLYYQTFIRGLLDVTDNYVGGKVVQPPRVVRYDVDDPYLVVAADKGTAHLSDTANKISIEYGFWLGDAFASGGRNGYDHKVMGITAKGGWVLVKRHFAEMGKDPYKEEFTAFGVGDCGGDVFGNGVIETPHMKLRAAFNHVHIFLDPSPNAAASYTERKRLFDAVKGWDAYDRSLISEGGGVFERRARSVPLSPQAQAMLGIDAAEADPDSVIRAILRMEADLFWNGGIGTYVKASFETHQDADDKTNNPLRIDATELRCKIVGEGGNLGFTQRARIEAGLRGVRLNTDAIDNSGGVDTSDHEVNLKILLNPMVQQGRMTMEERNTLLGTMTDEVAGLVLADNDAHGRQLTRDVIRSRQNPYQFARAIAFIEREFTRDRATLYLPSDAEIAERATRGEGLTRPELAVLQAWVKMYARNKILAANPRELAGFDELLRTYFPQKIQQLFPAEIKGHMLANEIATTAAVSRIVADAGAAMFPLNVEMTGASIVEIANAYLKAQQLGRMKEVRSTLEQLRATVALPVLSECWVIVDGGCREVVRYWLSSRGRIPNDEELAAMQDAADHVAQLESSDVRARDAKELARLKAAEIPAAVAERTISAQYLNVSLAIWAETKRSGKGAKEATVRYLATARASRLQDVLDTLASRPAAGKWDPIAFTILYNRTRNLLNQLVAKVPPVAVDATVDSLVPELRAGKLAHVYEQIDRVLGSEATPSVATLLVLEERVATAIARLA